VKLGGSVLEVSRIGLGTIRWGDTTKGFGPMFDQVSVSPHLLCICFSGLSQTHVLRHADTCVDFARCSPHECEDHSRSYLMSLKMSSGTMQEDLYSAYEAARVGGINLFDTAEVSTDLQP